MRLWLSALLASVGILAAAGENLALKKSVKASSRENTRFLPEFAVDGKTRTRWSSQQRNDPQWLMVDLGAVKSWKDVVWKKDGKGGVETLVFPGQNARFVRFAGQYRIPNASGYSIQEFQVFEQ